VCVCVGGVVCVCEVSIARASERDQRVERVESNRKRPQTAGRKAAKNHRPRPEHKHTAQTGRTNPTRLGSSSRKSPATRATWPPGACTGRSPRVCGVRCAGCVWCAWQPRGVVCLALLWLRSGGHLVERFLREARGERRRGPTTIALWRYRLQHCSSGAEVTGTLGTPGTLLPECARNRTRAAVAMTEGWKTPSVTCEKNAYLRGTCNWNQFYRERGTATQLHTPTYLTLLAILPILALEVPSRFAGNVPLETPLMSL
jgi:hypothetical protein